MNVTYPGYVLMSEGTKIVFEAASKRMAIMAAATALGLRSMTRKAFMKAHAIAIYFGIQPRQVFPFRQQRSKDARADRMRNRERLPITDRKSRIDVGRRRRYVYAPPTHAGLFAA